MKIRFLKTHKYCYQKWGKKTRELFFLETHVYRKQKTMEKNRLEKVRKHVSFYKYTNNVTKNWGEKKRDKFFF